MLQIKNLSKSYGAKKAVSNLSFVVEDGDIMGFIGKNGAGKTTTLKACLGIIGIDEGEILLDGTSVLKKPMACKRKMAYVPDNPQLDEYMTGLQYLNFICDIYEVPSKMRKQNFEKLASAFQVGPHLNNLISSYSHGMKQKLALIAAFSHTPILYPEVAEQLRLQIETIDALYPDDQLVLGGVHGFVFRNRTGSFMSAHNINRAIERISVTYNMEEMDQAELEDREPDLLPHFSVHNLRHTFCTRLCESTNDVKFIQQVMGHADFSTTMDIYTHITQENMQEKAKNISVNMKLM